ncbi:diguanylate cyclase [Dechloromonas sp. XY25]|uniref:diguanylate cyclase n=1 Tax=Dechloromonas hankyongensis TaxID=2908002 RepID=A0ABS9K6G2_9RHOO|nr:diguanylate cyclase [Dechloromonas hankyongensis]MCG2578761.1 diguanylate cyclase [Dechloromonas hankyongensis]
MSNLDLSWLSVLSFGFAAIAGACFVTFAQRWSPQTGQSFGRLLAASIVIAFGWWSAVLLSQLALSSLPPTLGELDAALLAVPPLVGGIMAALLLETSRQPLRRVLGAAGALTAAALLPPASIAQVTPFGMLWPLLLLAAGLVFVCLFPALMLISPESPSAWRNVGALLLLAVGILLPQIFRLAWWPADHGTAVVDESAWLSRVVVLDTGATIALFMLIQRLLGRDSQLRDAASPEAELAARLQAASVEKDSLVHYQERRCEHIIQSADVGIFEWEIRTGTLSLGGTWASMLDYEDEQATQLSRIPDPWRQLCHPHETALAQRLLRQLARGQREQALCELRLRSARNSWHWVMVNARVVEHFPDGRPQRVLGTLVDIDRLKRAEYALLAERRLFASGPVIVLTFEAVPPHRLRHASSNLPDARGYPEQHQPLGEPLAALFHRDDADGLAELMVRVVDQPGVPVQREVRVVRADNSWRWYVLHVVADRPEASALRAYLVDINRLKEAESNIAAHNLTLQGMVQKMAATQHFMQTLQQFTELLQVCENEAESRQIITQGGPQLFPDWSGALTVAGVSGLMEVIASWGEPFTSERTEETDCWAVRRGHLHQSNADSSALSPVCGHFGAGPTLPPGIQHAICAPLLKSFERPGVLHLIAHRKMNSDELSAITWGAELFADALKLSLGNLRLRASLREQAVHDVMTDLFNRRYFDEVLHREVSRSERTGEGLILGIIDIDHFKSFNDSFGHDAGDRVLRTVAEQLQDFVRAYDIACRVGGEELAVIMPRAHIEEGFARLDQLRQEIRGHRLTHNGVRLPAITVSIGIAELDGNSADSLLRRADAALYAAKHEGRDRVMRWDPSMDLAFSSALAQGERRPTRH